MRKIGILSCIILISLISVILILTKHNTVKTNKETSSYSTINSVGTVASKEKSSESKPLASSGFELQKTEDIVSENYTIQRGDIKLYGVITASRNYKTERRPLVVISHGFNNTLEMYEEYADYLAKLGFIVYRFDFYGGSKNSKSGGTDMLSMSVLTEKNDLSSVVETLSKESFVNSDEISLLGASQGGVVSTLYAAENPELIKKLILIFPAFVLFDDVKETYSRLNVTSIEDIPEVITHKNARLGAIYLRDALGIAIDSEIKKVTSPVLIIQGTNDEVVPYQYAVKANQLFPQSELVTVQGGAHWIDSQFNQVAIPAIDQFMTK